MSTAREATEQLLHATEELERALASADPAVLEAALQRRVEVFAALRRATEGGAVPPADLLESLRELDARITEGALLARDALVEDVASLRHLRGAAGRLRRDQPPPRFVSRRA